ncbi:hypothetical protein ROA7745_01715 [Roseovarius aestuarii]|uniref:Uncharacterized protein n=1 Tax=Roseovarius aestuarii TaxID=475083 RepID=A0A1X7BQM3_9RHOB|nr:hypothetical protein ROA7745_01715 [Roseovarius aestuarii]
MVNGKLLKTVMDSVRALHTGLRCLWRRLRKGRICRSFARHFAVMPVPIAVWMR